MTKLSADRKTERVCNLSIKRIIASEIEAISNYLSQIDEALFGPYINYLAALMVKVDKQPLSESPSRKQLSDYFELCHLSALKNVESEIDEMNDDNLVMLTGYLESYIQRL